MHLLTSDVSSLNVIGGNFRRSKRLHSSADDVKPTFIKSPANERGGAKSKRIRQIVDSKEEVDINEEKENFHRTKPLAPRSRAAKVLVQLAIELPTDASDYEVSDAEDITPVVSLGFLYQQRESRMLDKKNAHYHFEIFEDSS